MTRDLPARVIHFTANVWNEDEKTRILCARGFIRPSANNPCADYADGTPFLAIGVPGIRSGQTDLLWYHDNKERPIGPTAGFKDYVRYRKATGLQLVLNVIAAFPNWMGPTENHGIY